MPHVLDCQPAKANGISLFAANQPRFEHSYHERDDDLAHCKVCGGAEGSLPTDCPGVKMTSDQEDKVYGCELDFRGGEWVTLDPTQGAR